MAVYRDSTGVPARAGRATAFATASVCLALAAHTAGGGGHPPPLAVVIVAVGLATRVSYGLAGRERSLADITVGLGAGQFVLHVTFALAALSMVGHSGTNPGGYAHGAALPPDAVMLPDAVGSLTAALVPTPSMMFSHVLATAVVVMGFRQAERTLWTVVALRSWLAGVKVTALARLGCALLASGWVVTPALRQLPRPVTVCPDAASRIDAMIGRASRRRGPPGTAWTSIAVPVAGHRMPRMDVTRDVALDVAHT